MKLEASLLLAAALASRPAIADPNVQARYAHTFYFVGGAAERQKLDQAIEQSMDGLFFLVKPIARQRLRARTKIVPWVTLAFPAQQIKIGVPGYKPTLSPDSGAEVDYEVDGENVRLSQRLVGDHLVQKFRATDGTRVNEYVAADQGPTLLLHVTVESPRLPKPLRYTLSYSTRPPS